ncbi:phosphatidylinositol 4-phosphate 3-kinase C2 domain-containing subunit beta-like isoform X2 [Oscarella lobularis]|uniref:phosphatidylinositol 4-phosphate 3-kinase C2 domain-containing subunit beta-like isoform X2 n=1 Tax=Oscarella lobularis TaxID=121494 RepID=UPI003313EF82
MADGTSRPTSLIDRDRDVVSPSTKSRHSIAKLETERRARQPPPIPPKSKHLLQMHRAAAEQSRRSLVEGEKRPPERCATTTPTSTLPSFVRRAKSLGAVAAAVAKRETDAVRRRAVATRRSWRDPRAKSRWSTRKGAGSNRSSRLVKTKSDSAMETEADPRDVFFGDGLFDLAEERNEELVAFRKTVTELRRSYLHFDETTNPRYLTCPVVQSSSNAGVAHVERQMSFVAARASSLRSRDMIDVELMSKAEGDAEYHSTQVTCTRRSTAAELITISGFDSTSHTLKVCGRAEYLNDRVPLDSSKYVLDCWRLSRLVRLVVVPNDLIPDYFSRSEEDDDVDGKESSFRLYYEQPLATAVSKRGLSVLMEAFQRECKKLHESGLASRGQVNQVVQSVKALCSVLACVEPSCVTDAVSYLRKLAGLRKNASTSSVQEDDASVEENSASVSSKIHLALIKLTSAVHTFINIYCSSFDTDFSLSDGVDKSVARHRLRTSLTEVKEKFRFKICSACRIPYQCKSYDYFQIESGLYYGDELIVPLQTTWHQKLSMGFHDRLSWEEWNHFDIPVSRLPRETRLCLTLYGYKGVQGDDLSTGSKEPIGWVGQCLFNFRSILVSGPQLLGLWPNEKANPVGTNASNLLAPKAIILHVEFESFGDSIIYFPSEETPPPESSTLQARRRRSMESSAASRTDLSNKHSLKMIVTKDLYSSVTTVEKFLLWSNRHSCASFLHAYPRSLPVLLTAVPAWSYPECDEVHKLARAWDLVDPANALELLHFRHVDSVTRATAVTWLSKLSDEDLSDYLPQLVQAFKYESYHDSPLVRLLVERALTSGRVAHHLFWQLKQNLADERFSRRFAMTWAALLGTCGTAKREHFLYQEHVVELLSDVAATVKAASGSARQSVLIRELRKISDELTEPFSLPLNPALEVDRIDIDRCGYFNSNAVPLRLVFKNSDPVGDDVEAIFKVGDDLRQDALVIQMLRIMDKLWLRDGVDLRIVTFDCVPTAENMGMVEMVTEAETLGKIQTQVGVTGSFRDRPLADWLLRHNSSEASYQKAVENFTLSCAGYCVATYVLGICDRHNDNIMVRKTGHMFHIDFGKILGNAQMFGAIKRDRAPFVLTPDMAYVINGGDKPSSKFQHFVDVACQAFNVIRRHSGLFINLFGLMLSSGMPQLASVNDIRHIRDALLPKVSDAEATSTFTRLIGESLGSLATQLNFFIHNLAQMRFTGASRSTGLFAFIPQIYSCEVEGEIKLVEVTGFEKRTDPVKYYVYVVSVTRVDGTTSVIYRRYSEFHEFHAKLTEAFPSQKFPSFPGKIYVGRSHIRQVSEKRRAELNDYLRGVLSMDTEVSKSDYVYSFLHCLLRDEKDRRRERSPSQAVISNKHVGGEVKLSISYNQRKASLVIMVVHCRNLCPRDSNGLADPYVKLYLLPDANKSTKRKTKIVKKSLNPTYNESFQYAIAFNEIRRRTLQCTVWDHDLFSGNDFMGCALIALEQLDLSQEHEAWHKLEEMNNAD